MRDKLRRQAPLIFTCVSTAGVMATAVLSARGGMKAEKILQREKPEDLKDAAISTWKCYILPAATGIVTITCIVASHRLSSKDIARLASVATASGAGFSKYRDKVREVLGNEKEQEIYEEVREDFAIYPLLPNSGEGANTELFYDCYSGRHFRSSTEKVQQAIYHFNRMLTLKGIVTLNEFYEFIGIDGIQGGDDIGWSQEHMIYREEICAWIDLFFDKTPTDDGEICNNIFFDFGPTEEALRFDWT